MNHAMNQQLPQLVEPSVGLESAYRSLHQEFLEADEEIFLGWREAEESFAQFVGRLLDHAQGVALPGGWVPASRYWFLADKNRILGEVDIRLRLTPELEDYGGHIGYWIRPSERGKGHGTRMLAQALNKARALGLSRVLITCDPRNLASVRIIEHNGGVLASQSVAHIGRLTSRYWIEL